MRIHYPGAIMIPMVLTMLCVMAIMNSFGIIQVARTWSLWPVGLIATGLEELYLWASTKSR